MKAEKVMAYLALVSPRDLSRREATKPFQASQGRWVFCYQCRYARLTIAETWQTDGEFTVASLADCRECLLELLELVAKEFVGRVGCVCLNSGKSSAANRMSARL